MAAATGFNRNTARTNRSENAWRSSSTSTLPRTIAISSAYVHAVAVAVREKMLEKS